jgi:hypothetical protein
LWDLIWKFWRQWRHNYREWIWKMPWVLKSCSHYIQTNEMFLLISHRLIQEMSAFSFTFELQISFH